jgi:DNA polymerase
MGEPVTQMLLQSSEPLTKLRGKAYERHDVTLIATYDLAHLLQNLPDKAKTWDDLRLAMHTMQDLKL